MQPYRHMTAALAAFALACGEAKDATPDAAAGDSADVAAEPPPEPAPETPAAAPAEEPAAQPRDTIHLRPVDITLTIANALTYQGTYQASGISRGCGNMVLSMTGDEKAFNVEFPSEGDFEITDLSFSADTLVPGTTTDKYYLSVSLKTKDGGRPPSFVIRANEPRFNETGRATLSVEGGTARLTVEGRNYLGPLQMTVVCKPKEG